MAVSARKALLSLVVPPLLAAPWGVGCQTDDGARDASGDADAGSASGGAAGGAGGARPLGGAGAGGTMAAGAGGRTGADASTGSGGVPAASGGVPAEAGAEGGSGGAGGVEHSLVVGVGSWGLRGFTTDGAAWSYCGNPSTGNDHSPDLLRNVAHGDGVFVAVGGDANSMVMRSLDGVHWQEDLHPTTACDGEEYPASCRSWMGAVAFGGGVWLAGGGNGALMRSRDGGVTWSGLHPDPTPSAIRSLAFGNGRFVAGTDSGDVIVSADDGETWIAHRVWSHAVQVTHGGSAFVASGAHWNGAGFDRACVVGSNDGEGWTPCHAAVAGASSFVHDGTRWVAAIPGGYATSVDAAEWTSHDVSDFPDRLLYREGIWLGRRGGDVLRGTSPDTLVRVASDVPDFRAWTVGGVQPRNLPVTGVPECQDDR